MTQPTMISVDPLKRGDAFYRYKMPSVVVKIEGSGNGIKTVFPNIEDICDAISRPVEFVMKLLQLEIGAQRTMKKSNDATKYLIMGRFDQDRIQKLLDGFVEKFVLCPKCRSPETQLSADEKGCNVYSSCDACGQKKKLKDNKHANTVLMRILLADKTTKNKKAVGGTKEDEEPSKVDPDRHSSAVHDDGLDAKKESSSEMVSGETENAYAASDSITSKENLKETGGRKRGEEENTVGDVPDLKGEEPTETGLRAFRKVLNSHPKNIKYQVDVVASVVRQYLQRYCRTEAVGVMIVMAMLKALFPNRLCEGVQKYQSLLLHFTCPTSMDEQQASLDEIEKSKIRKEEARQRVRTLRDIARTFRDTDEPYFSIDRLIHLVVVFYIEGIVEVADIKNWLSKPFGDKLNAESLPPVTKELLSKMQPVLTWLKVDGDKENNQTQTTKKEDS